MRQDRAQASTDRSTWCQLIFCCPKSWQLEFTVPLAFISLVAPMTPHGDGDLQLRTNAPKIIAALFALAVATRTRNLLVPIIIGMAVLHGLQWLLRLG